MSAAEADRYLTSQPDAVCVRIEYDGAGRAIHAGVGVAAIATVVVAAAAASAAPLLEPATTPDIAMPSVPRMGAVRIADEDIVPVIVITKLGIALDDRPLAAFTGPSTFDFPHPDALVGLGERPRDRREQLDKRPGFTRRGVFILVVDAWAPSNLVRDVLDTASGAGFDRPRFITRTR